VAYTKQTIPAGMTAQELLQLAAEAIQIARRRADGHKRQIEWRDRKIEQLEARGRDAQVEELEKKLRTAYRQIEDLQDQLAFRTDRIAQHMSHCGSDEYSV
jgi:predicted RNase H-like nuclease (RuvC/YqgF family)